MRREYVFSLTPRANIIHRLSSLHDGFSGNIMAACLDFRSPDRSVNHFSGVSKMIVMARPAAAAARASE